MKSYWFPIAAVIFFLVPPSILVQAKEKKSKWLTELKSHLVKTPGVPTELAPDKLTALYFSADWCGPCKAFTPQLLKFAEANKDQFQIVFVSLDRSKEKQLAYMNESGLLVPAIAWNNPVRNGSLGQKAEWGGQFSNGIPHLAIFDSRGNLLSSDARSEIVFAPGSLDTIKAPWRQMLESWHTKNGTKPLETAAAFWAIMEQRYQGNAALTASRNWFDRFVAEEYTLFQDGDFIRQLRETTTNWNWKELSALAEIGTRAFDSKVEKLSFFGSELYYSALRDVIEACNANISDKEWLALIKKHDPAESPELDLKKEFIRWFLAVRSTGDHPELHDRFWQCYDRGVESSWIQFLSPALEQGDPKAVTRLERAARAPALSALVTSSLDGLEKKNLQPEVVKRVRDIMREAVAEKEASQQKGSATIESSDAPTGVVPRIVGIGVALDTQGTYPKIIAVIPVVLLIGPAKSKKTTRSLRFGPTLVREMPAKCL